jgi:hypothetical protein
MLERVSAGEVLPILIAGATFLPLAIVLGHVLAARGIAARDARGRVNWRHAGVIVAAFTVLVATHVMVLLWLDGYHPAVNTFYVVSGALLSSISRAKPVARPEPPRA